MKKVYKFGGSSLHSSSAREQARGHVRQGLEEGHEIMVVVSAMGRKGSPYATDTLLGLLSHSASPLSRDLLVSCGEEISACVFSDELEEMGIKSRPFTAFNGGIIGDGSFGNAAIISLEGEKIQSSLRKGEVPVVSGFQAMSPEGEITTLGRGGSDTSAVKLGALLNFDEVHLFTDVSGVYTIDPRLTNSARILRHMSYRDMLTLARRGSGVVHPRAVEEAMKRRIPLFVRSTFSQDPGTRIEEESGEHALIGIAIQKKERMALISALFRGEEISDWRVVEERRLFEKEVPLETAEETAIRLHEELL